jgi:UDP-2-acetamido-3-amino-2,3-dideoxy-glucuronate N-acetyltransferase
MNYKCHSTSIIDEGAQIGDNSIIWHWSHICSKSKIGNDVRIGQNVYIANNSIIGNNCKIQNNVSIYDGVTLESDVFCGPGVVFTNVYNPRSHIDRKGEFKKTLIKKGATLGANCTIICGVTIGEFAFIGAGAVVTKTVKSYALMVGVPSKQIGWMGEYGKKLDLPLTGNAQTTCQQSGKKYQLKDSKVSVIS